MTCSLVWAERVAKAEATRAELATKQAEAEAWVGRPRKVRADQRTPRGPNKVRKEKLARPEVVRAN
jgi:hypothetical protein